MKVYGCPKEVAWEEPDYKNYDWSKEGERIKAHEEKLKAWLQASGYKGSNTGRVVQFQVADGYAVYMLAEFPKTSFLIHLPYGDGYSYPDVKYLPKKAVLERAEQREKLNALFAAKGAA